MKDDELARALLLAAARDPEGDRAREWESLAAGSSSARDRDALARLAAEDGDLTAMEALAPLDDALFARVEARIAPPRRLPRVVGVMSALALAAGVALVLGRALPARHALPEYAFQLEGAQKTVRRADPSATDGLATFTPDSPLRLVIRPAQNVHDPVEVATAMIQDGHPNEWHPIVRTSASGAAEIQGPASVVLGGSPGERELVVAVGRPSSLPHDPAAIAALGATSDVRVFHVRVRLLPP